MDGHARRCSGCALALAAALALTACGAQHENRDRPPAPITITAAIREQRVKVSPHTFGAGPIRIIISNQTGSAQELTVETAGKASGVTRTTAPIIPDGTATLELDLTEGDYAVSTGDDGVAPAAVQVGAPRPSSQNDLLLP